jgi:hypothetical protein
VVAPLHVHDAAIKGERSAGAPETRSARSAEWLTSGRSNLGGPGRRRSAGARPCHTEAPLAIKLRPVGVLIPAPHGQGNHSPNRHDQEISGHDTFLTLGGHPLKYDRRSWRDQVVCCYETTIATIMCARRHTDHAQLPVRRCAPRLSRPVITQGRRGPVGLAVRRGSWGQGTRGPRRSVWSTAG